MSRQHASTVRGGDQWTDDLPASRDPVADLRAGWDHFVRVSVWRRVVVDDDTSPVWRALVERVAATGRLAISVDHAAELVRCASLGVTLGLLATRDHDLGRSDRLREEVLSAILRERGQGSGVDLPSQAVALMAALETAAPDLTRGERAVLQELLERLVRDHPQDTTREH